MQKSATFEISATIFSKFLKNSWTIENHDPDLPESWIVVSIWFNFSYVSANVLCYIQFLQTLSFFQFSTAWDFFITCLGMSYVLWNPFLYGFFNPKFQVAVKEFIREEVSYYFEFEIKIFRFRIPNILKFDVKLMRLSLEILHKS